MAGTVLRESRPSSTSYMPHHPSNCSEYYAVDHKHRADVGRMEVSKGSSGPTWEPNLHHRALMASSDSLDHSSGLVGRAGSCPSCGSVGLGCSSLGGRGTGWHAWYLKSRVQRWMVSPSSRGHPAHKAMDLDVQCCELSLEALCCLLLATWLRKFCPMYLPRGQ